MATENPRFTIRRILTVSVAVILLSMIAASCGGKPDGDLDSYCDLISKNLDLGIPDTNLPIEELDLLITLAPSEVRKVVTKIRNTSADIAEITDLDQLFAATFDPEALNAQNSFQAFNTQNCEISSKVVENLVIATQDAFQAELENSRKRMRREKDEQRRFAVFPLLSDLLPVVDNLGRAVQSANENPDAESLLAGVEMVATQLAAILEQHKCQQISAAGEPFDPNLHEAIGQQPSSECPEGHVAHVALEGYSLHDRVIRPSQVLVSTGTPGPPDEPSEGSQAE